MIRKVSLFVLAMMALAQPTVAKQTREQIRSEYRSGQAMALGGTLLLALVVPVSALVHIRPSFCNGPSCNRDLTTTEKISGPLFVASLMSGIGLLVGGIAPKSRARRKLRKLDVRATVETIGPNGELTGLLALSLGLP